MKKLFSLATITVLLISICSCQNENIQFDENVSKISTIETTSNGVQSIKDSISALNKNLIKYRSHPNGTKMGKSFWKNLFGRGLKVFTADCVGALKGLFGGKNIWQNAKSSSLSTAKVELINIGLDTAKDIFKSPSTGDTIPATIFVNPRDSALNEVILSNQKNELDINDSIGYYHNRIIYDLLQKENDAKYWASLSDEDILKKVNNAIIDVIPETNYCDTTLTQETIDFCIFISNSARNRNSAIEMLDDIKNQYSEMADLIDILTFYIRGMEDVATQEEWEQYCKDVIRIVSTSKLTNKQKECLRAGIAVGYASTKLWNTEVLDKITK